LGGVIAVGAILLVVSLGLPGGPGAAGGDPGASQPAVVATVAPPSGAARIEFKGNQSVVYDLVGQTGAGPAVADHVDATWGDGLGNSLALAGRAGSGTRTTSPELVLTLTTRVNDAPVTFVSQAGECTVGMASQPKTVTGSYVCKKLRSDDGLHVIDVSGTYRT
jgi:hypothetical protein